MKDLVNKLSSKQRRFCELIVFEKLTAVDAYVNAGYSKNSAYKNASHLRKKREIADYIKKLQDEITESYILSARERMKILSEMAKNADTMKDVRGAIDILNKMTGEYTQKHDINVAGRVIIGLPKRDE